MSGIYYGDYLQLDRLLASQAPESDKTASPAHDEMLFIIVHQAYELWFKQILHEMDRVQRDFAEAPLSAAAQGRIIHGLDRIKKVFDLVVRQIDVLETMTPLDFLDFRDLLRPASGFQSAQFRLIETRLGLGGQARVDFGGKRFEDRLSAADRAMVAAAQGQPALIDQLDRWLARTPFVNAGDYVFTEAYRQAVIDMLTRDMGDVGATPGISASEQAAEEAAIAKALDDFRDIFEPERGAANWRMSARAVQAALFIIVYRAEPALQGPFRLIELLMDIDEAMTMWRYRHAVMVERMIGVKLGTGGSSGHSYLRTTAERHRVFTDLFRLSTYLIPRHAIPPLPAEVARRLAFVYATPPAAE
jgi:tryptophan 2,3-dioxygenase